MKTRLISLDILRAIAVMLVLFRHFGYIEILGYIGWSGVDLFFVLSGFLVSGLLFKEYLSTRSINPKRFLIRRGLKIYPPFYFFIGVTLIKSALVWLFALQGNKNFSFRNLFGELIFMQNYFGRLWAHTWSLAVEEHFYILLIILVVFLSKKQKLLDTSKMNRIALFIFLSCFAFRVINFLIIPYTQDTHMFYTHLRIDSLFFGVYISYHLHFNKRNTDLFINKHYWMIFFLTVLFLSSMFIFDLRDFFMNTFGLSLVYLGYGGLIVLLLPLEKHFQKNKFLIGKGLTWAFSQIGKHSYSIYLWHLAILVYLIEPVFFEMQNGIKFILYFITSILFGIVASILIEKPILAIREKKFPQ